MPLILTVTTIPDDAYWGPVPSGLGGWSENGAFDLYPNTNELQDLGLPTKRINTLNGTDFNLGNTINSYPGQSSLIVSYHEAGSQVGASSVYGSFLISHISPKGVPGLGGTVTAYHGSLTVVEISDMAYAASSVSSNKGSVVCGYTINTGYISAYKAGIAVGSARYYGNMRAVYGSLAIGYAGFLHSYLQATHGSIAAGCADSSGGAAYIQAIGKGSSAFGYSAAGEVIARGAGSHAIGNAYGYDVHAYNAGSIAWGYASTGHAYANALGSMQINSGTNSTANSMKVGADTTGIRIIGSGVISLRDGDMWCDGTDVFVRTSGGIKNLSNIP